MFYKAGSASSFIHHVGYLDNDDSPSKSTPHPPAKDRT